MGIWAIAANEINGIGIMTRSLMAIDPEKLAQPVVLGEIEHVLAGTLKQSTVRWMGKSLQARSWRTAGVADRLSPRRRHWAAMTISEVTCGNDCRNLCINGSLLEVMNRVKRDRQQSLQNCRSSGKDGSRLIGVVRRSRPERQLPSEPATVCSRFRRLPIPQFRHRINVPFAQYSWF